jgi:hypothetical protein
MAKKDFPLDIDLMKNELQNSSFHKLSVPPSNPVVGQFYFDTDDKIPYYWNGLLWRDFGGSTDAVESVTSTDNHIVVDNTDSLNPSLSFQLVDNENLLTDDELVVVQNTSGTNTGDQDLTPYLKKDTTLQSSDTPEDTSLFSFWKIGVGRVKIAFSELITNVMHSQLGGLDWLTSGHTGTANKLFGSDANGLAKEYTPCMLVTSSANSGTINLGVNTTTVLSTVLSSSHTITVTPTAPTDFTTAQLAQLDFTTATTTPSITLTAPSGVTFKWRHAEITAWTASKTYTIQFVWISSTRCDIYYLIS